MNTDSTTPGTSTGCSDDTSSKPSNCQVCNMRAHGNHFGVDTCRACAAFFRRVYVTHKQHFQCRERDNKCTPDVYGRWNCKRCRTQRCFDLGMRPDNIQLNRDVFLSSKKFLKKRTLKKQDSPSFEAVNKKDIITYFDMTPLFESTEKILMTVPHLDKDKGSLSSLEKLAHGLREIRKAQLWKDVPEILVFGKNESFNHWKTEMERASTWLTYFDEFRELDIEDKMTITNCMWLVFARLERSSVTAQMRRMNRCQKNEYVVKTDGKLNYDTVQWDFNWLSPYPDNQLKTFIGTTPRMFCEQLVHSLMDVQPTDEELCYLLCDLCFYHIGNKLGGRIQEITERLQQVLSDDLHRYYLATNRSSRYSHRLNKLLKINQLYKVLMEEKRKATFLGKVFDAFRVEWSHPDMFRLGNFE